MAQPIKAGLIRFPHVEKLFDNPVELSDGAVLLTEEIPDDLGFEGDQVTARDKLANSTGFDVWELPVVRYIAAREVGFDATAIPVFLTRRFVQWMIEVPADSGIRGVKDLAGKRIGEPYHGNTDTVWTKGVLAEDYGVDLSGASFFSIKPERVRDHEPPDGVTCVDRSTLDELMLKGIVDAVFGSGHGIPTVPGVRRLWADPERAAAEWYQSSPVFPILHLVVVRNSALAAHPGLAADLYRVFDRVKEDALAAWDYGAALPTDKRGAALWSGFPGSAWGGADRGFLGRDPLPYGIGLDANREALGRIIRYAHQQGAIRRRYTVEELFEPISS
jgi:4,5-dihydroxyphthalate decarboxylase